MADPLGGPSAQRQARPASTPVHCSKPCCCGQAAARLTYDHAQQQAWLDPAGSGDGGLGLCASHAERFAVPGGWQLIDRRPSAVAVFAPVPAGPPLRPVSMPVGARRLVRVHRLAS